MTSDHGAVGKGPGVVLGVIGGDIHVVANRILHIGLGENGFHPYNLGADNDLLDFAHAALETGARAVLVASINGEAEAHCTGAGAAFAAAGLDGTLLYLGGNLAVGDRPAAEVEQRFLAEGFDRVFHRPPSFHVVFDALRKDLGVA